jgi:hypothetical protein
MTPPASIGISVGDTVWISCTDVRLWTVRAIEPGHDDGWTLVLDCDQSTVCVPASRARRVPRPVK